MPAAMASHVSNAGAVKREPMTALDDCRGAGRAAPHVDKPREGMVQRPASMRVASASARDHTAPSAATLNAITTAILSRGIDPRYPLDAGGIDVPPGRNGQRRQAGARAASSAAP